MKTLTPEAQIEAFKAAARSRVARHLHRWMIGAAIILAMLSAILWHPVPLAIALFLGVIGAVEHRAMPNVVRAIEAYETATPTTGMATITVTRWDTDDHYHARIREAGQPDWTYEFIPQGWRPSTNACPAQIWRLDSREAPALVMVEQGILVPRYAPQQLPADKTS